MRKREKGSVKGYAFLISLIVILVSYMFLIYNETLAVEGKLNPAFSMWSIPSFFFLGTLYFLIFPKREIKLKPFPSPAQEKKEIEKKRFKRTSINFHLMDRYLLRSFIPYFLLSLLAISSLFIIMDFAQIVEEITRNKVSLKVVFYYYLFSLPKNLYDFIIPLCILSSLGIGIALLEKNREITALKALGVSFSRISLSLLAMTFAIGIISFLFAEIYLPEINQKGEDYRDMIFGKKNLPKFARLFGQDTYVASDKGWIYKYRTFDKKNLSIIGFEGFNFSQKPEIFLLAREIYFADGKWIVSEGAERKIFEDRIEFKKLEKDIYNLPDGVEVFSSIFDNPSNLNLVKLKRYISNLKRAGYKPYSWEVKLWQKVFYPFFILLIGFIAIVFSFSFKSTHQIWGNLARILFIGLLYWILIIFFGKMGEMQMLKPFLAAFSPNFLFMIFGLYYYLGIKD
ncbi:MAG: LptF/LptG family permease [Thermoanaerobaculia bacterium]